MVSLRQNVVCVYIPNYSKNVTEVLKDLDKRIIAVNALATDPLQQLAGVNSF